MYRPRRIHRLMWLDTLSKRLPPRVDDLIVASQNWYGWTWCSRVPVWVHERMSSLTSGAVYEMDDAPARRSGDRRCGGRLSNARQCLGLVLSMWDAIVFQMNWEPFTFVNVQLNVIHFDAKIVVFISCVVSSYFSQVNMIALIFWV